MKECSNCAVALHPRRRTQSKAALCLRACTHCTHGISPRLCLPGRMVKRDDLCHRQLGTDALINQAPTDVPNSMNIQVKHGSSGESAEQQWGSLRA